MLSKSGAYFKVETKQKNYHFFVDSEESAKKWVEVVSKRVYEIRNLGKSPTLAALKQEGPPEPPQMPESERKELKRKMDDYQKQAVYASRSGKTETALEYLRLYKDVRKNSDLNHFSILLGQVCQKPRN